MNYFVIVLLALLGYSAWPFHPVQAGEGIVSQCREAFPEAADRDARLACINSLAQARVAEQERQMGVEQARLQANGLAAFGSGPALIQGMNQGFRQMEVHPYVLPMPAPVHTR